MFRIWVYTYILLALFQGDLYAFLKQSHERNMTLITVDSFEEPGNWVVKYSKYRSKNWIDDLEQPYEEAQKWLRWLNADAYVGMHHILPQHIKTNNMLSKERGVLGIRAKWDIQAYNWFILEPNNIRLASGLSEDALRLVADKNRGYLPREHKWDPKVQPNFIWMPEKVRDIFLFVWSGFYDYTVEAHFQDYKGNEYIVPMGNLKYKGWRSLSAQIPFRIVQTRKKVPSGQPLKFLRFKVISGKQSDHKGMYVYMDYFHAISNTYRDTFLGADLKYIDDFWDKKQKAEDSLRN